MRIDFNSYDDEPRPPRLAQPLARCVLLSRAEGNIMKIRTNVKAAGKPHLKFTFGLVFTDSSF